MYTRKDYINQVCTHDEYYAQFVTDRELVNVRLLLGFKIRQSADPESFNDIPLALWDRVPRPGSIYDMIKSVDPGGVSISDWVCVHKRAAKMILEGGKK